MKSIFFRIYSGMLIAVILIAILAYGLFSFINEQRLHTYMEQVSGGSFILIAEGLSRHDGDNRKKWFSIIKRLTGLEMQILTTLPTDFNTHQMRKIRQGEVLINADMDNKQVSIYLSMPGKNNQYLYAQITDFNEQLSRIAALLVINELRRHDATKRVQILEQLQTQFGFALQLKNINQVELDYSQARRVQKGDIVVALNDATSDKPYIQVFARSGIKNELLILGPIPLFNWFPRNVILILIFISIGLLGFCSYLLVRPLEKRLKLMERELDKIGTNLEPTMPVEGDDAISRFALEVNKMALRIQSLLDEQKELTHAISHELRTPIARMKFRLASLEDVLQGERRGKVLTGMQGDLNELNDLVDEILTLARLQNNREKQNFEQIEVAAFCHKLLDDIQMQHSQLKIEFFSQSTLDFMLGIEHLLQRAMQNLVLNATRYAKEHIKVEFFVENDHYYFRVGDDGVGIPEEEWDRIFTPFARIDKSRNRASGGFGLGLAIVQQVMQVHNGNAQLARSSLGGAEFTLCWPIHD